MQYNTQREKLSMPEYGRTIQAMIQHACQLEDKAQRQRCANTIIDVMAGMQPELSKQENFQNKLWDHLAYLAGYKLDIDYPVEITRLDTEATKPSPLSYPKRNIRNRHYGNIMEQFLSHLATMPEGDERKQLLELVANQMKQDLFDWNRDAMDPEKIASDIARYTDGRVCLDLSTFKFDTVIQGGQNDGSKKKKKKK